MLRDQHGLDLSESSESVSVEALSGPGLGTGCLANRATLTGGRLLEGPMGVSPDF